jgi:hypothetical protein
MTRPATRWGFAPRGKGSQGSRGNASLCKSVLATRNPSPLKPAVGEIPAAEGRAEALRPVVPGAPAQHPAAAILARPGTAVARGRSVSDQYSTRKSTPVPLPLSHPITSCCEGPRGPKGSEKLACFPTRVALHSTLPARRPERDVLLNRSGIGVGHGGHRHADLGGGHLARPAALPATGAGGLEAGARPF